MLSQLLTPERISRNICAKDWEEAVRQAGQLLVDTQCVEHRYVDEMVNISREAGPYIVIVPGVALAHARPSDGAKELSMSLITLNTPVNFGNEDNDPVRVVFALAALDNSHHLNALRELVRFINEPRNIDKLCRSENNKEVVELIQAYDTSC